MHTTCKKLALPSPSLIAFFMTSDDPYDVASVRRRLASPFAVPISPTVFFHMDDMLCQANAVEDLDALCQHLGDESSHYPTYDDDAEQFDEVLFRVQGSFSAYQNTFESSAPPLHDIFVRSDDDVPRLCYHLLRCGRFSAQHFVRADGAMREYANEIAEGIQCTGAHEQFPHHTEEEEEERGPRPVASSAESPSASKAHPIQKRSTRPTTIFASMRDQATDARAKRNLRRGSLLSKTASQRTNRIKNESEINSLVTY